MEDTSIGVESDLLSQSLAEASELQRVFHDYKTVLRATGFKTPLQRALSLTNQAKAASLAQKRRGECLGNLLPPGPNTVHTLDVVQVLANSSKPYSIRVPLSLLISNKVKLVDVGINGIVKVKVYDDVRSGLIDFRAEALNKYKRCRYVHKAKGQASVLLQTFVEAEETIRTCDEPEQRLQLYIEPHPKKTSQLRALWSCNRARNVYYTKTQAPRLQSRQPCLVRALPELNRSSTLEINTLKTDTSLAATRLKPIPEIDNALVEFVRALQENFKSHKVKELVCDFLLDRHKQWVLVGCLGYCFFTHRKVRSQVIEHQKTIDLKFLLVPLMSQNKAAMNRLQLPKESLAGSRTDTPEKSPATQLLTHSQILKKREPQMHYPQLSFFNRTVTEYESILTRVTRYKQQLHVSVDFVEKYGLAFWQPLLVALFQMHFFSLRMQAKGFEPLGVEEQRMKQCGYMRVLRGNYNFYYENALERLHGSRGVMEEDYEFFLYCVVEVLKDAPVVRHDAEVIVKRFRELKHCFCSKS